MAALITMLVAVVSGYLAWRYDRRTDAEKLEANGKALGIAVGVPGLFDKKEP